MSYQSDSNEDAIKKRILELKEKKNAFILAHNYQLPGVQDVADFVGDSLEMAKVASKVEFPLIVVCGVYFMAEMVKLLNPDKKVLIPDKTAGCPLADTASAEEVLKKKKELGEGTGVVSYINTYADVKAVSDVICTSANAPDIVSKVDFETVLFVPDRNLAHYTISVLKSYTGSGEERVSERELKKIVPWTGYCPVHEKVVSVEDIRKARKKHPGAVVVVHPETPPEVQKEADYVRSTGGMVRLVRELGESVEEYVIGTEVGMLYRLSKDFPSKKFYPLNEAMICVNMKKITLGKLLNSLEEDIFEIKIPEEIYKKAIVPIKAMLEMSR